MGVSCIRSCRESGLSIAPSVDVCRAWRSSWHNCCRFNDNSANSWCNHNKKTGLSEPARQVNEQAAPATDLAFHGRHSVFSHENVKWNDVARGSAVWYSLLGRADRPGYLASRSVGRTGGSYAVTTHTHTVRGRRVRVGVGVACTQDGRRGGSPGAGRAGQGGFVSPPTPHKPPASGRCRPPTAVLDAVGSSPAHRACCAVTHTAGRRFQRHLACERDATIIPCAWAWRVAVALRFALPGAEPNPAAARSSHAVCFGAAGSTHGTGRRDDSAPPRLLRTERHIEREMARSRCVS